MNRAAVAHRAAHAAWIGSGTRPLAPYAL